MKTVYKYSLVTADEQAVMLPAGAEILCVQVQKSQPFIWALVDKDSPLVERQISIRGTGHNMDAENSPEVKRRYIGTFQIAGGDLVFNVFEVVQ